MAFYNLNSYLTPRSSYRRAKNRLLFTYKNVQNYRLNTFFKLTIILIKKEELNILCLKKLNIQIFAQSNCLFGQI